MTTFTEAIYSVARELHLVEDTRTQPQIMLDMLQHHKEWVKTDLFREKGIRDPVTCKWRLTMKGYLIGTEQEKEGKFINKEGKYILLGKVCPPIRPKRDYLSGFTVEEIESELFRRDKLMSRMIDGELCHLIK